jgi:hypothetical protein
LTETHEERAAWLVKVSNMTADEVGTEIYVMMKDHDLRNSLQRAIAIGLALITAKEKCIREQREWLKFLAGRRPKISERDAQLKMDIARHPQAKRLADARHPISQNAFIQHLRKARKEARVRRGLEYEEAGAAVADEQNITLEVADFRTAPIPDASFEVCVLDPPWDRDHLHLYSSGAAVANRVLVDGGLCLVYVSMTFLPECLRLIGEHLTYGWLMGVMYPGNRSGYAWGLLKCRWRAVGLYCRGPKPRKPRKWCFDSYACKGIETQWKDVHPWAQSCNALTYWLSRLSRPADRICDLTLGGGTTAAVVKSLGKRSFYGCDISEKAVQKVRGRLKKVVAGSFKEVEVAST